MRQIATPDLGLLPGESLGNLLGIRFAQGAGPNLSTREPTRMKNELQEATPKDTLPPGAEVPSQGLRPLDGGPDRATALESAGEASVAPTVLSERRREGEMARRVLIVDDE